MLPLRTDGHVCVLVCLPVSEYGPEFSSEACFEDHVQVLVVPVRLVQPTTHV